MSDNIRDRAAARNKAQKQFAASEQRALNFREEQEKERAERNAKNVRLRALRLAKEAQDREEAAKLAAEAAAARLNQPASSGARKTRARTKKS